MCSQTDTEIGDASQIDRESTAPHKCQDDHNKHSAGWVRNVSKWISARVENILVCVVESKG